MSDTTDLTSDGDAARTPESAGSGTPSRRRRTGSGLSGMLLTELQGLASSLGITGTGRMRKGELIAAIQVKQASDPSSAEQVGQVARPQKGTDVAEREMTGANQTAGNGSAAPAESSATPVQGSEPDAAARGTDPGAGTGDAASVETPRRATRPAGPPASRDESTSPASNDAAGDSAATATAPAGSSGTTSSGAQSAAQEQSAASADADRASGGGAGQASGSAERGGDPASTGDGGPATEVAAAADAGSAGSGAAGQQTEQSTAEDRAATDQPASRNGGEGRSRGERRERSRGRSGGEDSADSGDAKSDSRGQSSKDQTGKDQAGKESGKDQAGKDDSGDQQGRSRGRGDDENEGGGGGRRRRGRYRDRRKRGDRGGGSDEPVVTEDDVLVPVAGILDVLDNYAFVRTSGYLAGPNDVYVSMSQIRKYGLRRGDAITGAVRARPENDGGGGGGNRRDKYNPLVRLDTINGMDPEEAKRRPEFYKLTPLYPQERLRLETEPHQLTTRVIDLVTPIGKGQRALIVSPPKAGKTMVLQALANAITHNNPECHLMVVLVDERPEEVTDMQRSVKGEVIAATFDRPPQDHTTVAELAIERAKRLVEMGHDVVVLLDSVTRLGRSYNLAAPASGRILSGGIDSTALYPPKRFLGAARNIENGGSLTIIATALVETGSTMDTVIFEEFKGTGNSELKLDRKIADKRVFPAVDVNASSTRKEEILLAPEELAIVHKLRRVLAALDTQQALDLLLDRLKQTKTNIEFLRQIATSTPGE